MDLIEAGRQLAQYVQARTRALEGGSSIIEYALLVMLIAVVCILAITFLGHATSGRISSVASQVAAS
jgi:Flp pilus assembly pilin Flp